MPRPDMPLVRDREEATTMNPASPQRIGRYTTEEQASLQKSLARQLGPEYLNSKPGPGQSRIQYLSTSKSFELANEIFGFNGWSTSIRDLQIDFVDENPSNGKISMAVAATVRVTLKDGSYHEDIGYGSIQNCGDKASAFDKTRKEAVSDAKKRALRTFGNALGNCVYDKDYLAKLSKVKVGRPRFDVDNLHRHTDYMPIKQEAMTSETTSLATTKPNTGSNNSTLMDVEDEYGVGDLDEVDFGSADETEVDSKPNPAGVAYSPSKAPQGTVGNANINVNKQTPNSLGSRPSLPPSAASTGLVNSKPAVGQQAPGMRATNNANMNIQRPGMNTIPGQNQNARTLTAPAQRVMQNLASNSTARGASRPTPPRDVSNTDRKEQETQPQIPSDAPVGFFTARAAETLQGGAKQIPETAAFNPRLESPSIRKTAGFDHSSSRPTTKDLEPALSKPATAPKPNFVNPHLDPTRRIGMPVGAASPLQNRGTFRQPQMKRPADGAIPYNGRTALNDVTATSVNMNAESPNDTKRQRVTGGQSEANPSTTGVGSS